MFIKLDAHMKSYGEMGYLAWIDSSKIKMSVHGATADEAAKELLISLKVTMAHLFGIDVKEIEEKEVKNEKEMYAEMLKDLKNHGHKELNFTLA